MRGDRVSPERLAELAESPRAVRLPVLRATDRPRHCEVTESSLDPAACGRPATWRVDDKVDLCVLDASNRIRGVWPSEVDA